MHTEGLSASDGEISQMHEGRIDAALEVSLGYRIDLRTIGVWQEVSEFVRGNIEPVVIRSEQWLIGKAGAARIQGSSVGAVVSRVDGVDVEGAKQAGAI